MARKINTDDPNLRKAVEELTMKALEDEDLEDISGGMSDKSKKALVATVATLGTLGILAFEGGALGGLVVNPGVEEMNKLKAEVFDEEGNLKVNESDEKYKEWKDINKKLDISEGFIVGGVSAVSLAALIGAGGVIKEFGDALGHNY